MTPCSHSYDEFTFFFFVSFVFFVSFSSSLFFDPLSCLSLAQPFEHVSSVRQVHKHTSQRCVYHSLSGKNKMTQQVLCAKIQRDKKNHFLINSSPHFLLLFRFPPSKFRINTVPLARGMRVAWTKRCLPFRWIVHVVLCIHDFLLFARVVYNIITHILSFIFLVTPRFHRFT